MVLTLLNVLEEENQSSHNGDGVEGQSESLCTLSHGENSPPPPNQKPALEGENK